MHHHDNVTSSKPLQQYAQFIDFGKAINPNIKNPMNPANPLTYCMFPTLNSQFFHGSTSGGMLYSNQNASCMSFMAGRCSKEWDGYCQAFMDLNPDTYWPNMAVVDSDAYNNGKGYWNVKPTVGQDLLRNSVYLKFIAVPGQKASVTPFDSNVANSPMITIYNNQVNVYSFVQNLDNPKQIDEDIHVQMMLQNPMICMDVLGRIYLAYHRNENDLPAKIKGTKLEEYFLKNKGVFVDYVAQAVRRVPSFGIQNTLWGWDS
jgi:hypothetical protein|uniref:Uncharacterized protein n=1 Tax=viral metagenome TaxID=1070528 RepID=A0A6C0K6R7_9ZZZZ